MSVVYDAGVLIAAERNDRSVWSDHRTRLRRGEVPITTAPVVAQVSRSGRQARLRRFLQGCHIVGFAVGECHDVGALLGRTRQSDVVDAHVVIVANSWQRPVLTSDVDDLVPLAGAMEPAVEIKRV